MPPSLDKLLRYPHPWGKVQQLWTQGRVFKQGQRQKTFITLSWDLINWLCPTWETWIWIWNIPKSKTCLFNWAGGSTNDVICSIFLTTEFMISLLQIEDVYETTYETCGQYWPYIHHYIIVAIVIMQVTMIGLFGLKSKPAASFSTIPLLVFTIVFNEYCKIRFLPTFMNYSIQVKFLASFILLYCQDHRNIYRHIATSPWISLIIGGVDQFVIILQVEFLKLKGGQRKKSVKVAITFAHKVLLAILI